MKESRYEGVLQSRRKTQALPSPMGNMSSQDAHSIGMDRCKASFLRGIVGGMALGMKTLNRSKYNE